MTFSLDPIVIVYNLQSKQSGANRTDFRLVRGARGKGGEEGKERKKDTGQNERK